MSITVYVAPLQYQAGNSGANQPAFRAWADALLIHHASVRDSKLGEAVSMRSTSRIARLAPRRKFVEPLTVDSSSCAAAKDSNELGLFLPAAWSEGLVEYLIDYGYDRDMLEEHLLPCSAPFVPVVVNEMPQVLAETRADLVENITRYFVDDLQRYLGSWRPLSAFAAPDEGAMEVIVPLAAGARQSRGE